MLTQESDLKLVSAQHFAETEYPGMYSATFFMAWSLLVRFAVNLGVLRLHQALQIGGESLSSNCCLTGSFQSLPMKFASACVGVSHLATAMVTFTDPGTSNDSTPASILAMGITPGDGIDSPSWR